jgi:hypothetical protein
MEALTRQAHCPFCGFRTIQWRVDQGWQCQIDLLHIIEPAPFARR